MAENKLTLESLAATVDSLTEKVAKLAEKVKESTIQFEEVAKEEKIDINGMSFTFEKTKYVFTRPSVGIHLNGKLETFTAKEVVEDEKLQAKFAQMAETGETTFVKAQK